MEVPRPWTYRTDADGYFHVEHVPAHGAAIRVAAARDEETAEAICRAANNYDALIKTIEHFLELADDAFYPSATTLADASTLLRKSRGEQP